MPASPQWRVIRTVAGILVVAAAYYVSGQLGLLLAVPPGYATPVWPASGIALAAVLVGGPRLACGAALGSFLVNAPTGPGLVIPGVIATAVAAQALAGGWLIHRFVGYTNLLEQDLKVIPTLLLGGPLACLIASTIGVGTLWLAGRVADSALLFNWWTWWVGDVIGVLVFAPLVLIWWSGPNERWFLRQLTLTVPLLVVFSLMVVLFAFISGREQARIESDFLVQGARFETELNQTIEAALNVLESMEGLFASAEDIRPYQFEIFGNRLLKHLPGVAGLSWNSWVPHAQRKAFESSARRNGLPGFRITEWGADRRMVPADTAEEYVPITFYVSRQPDEIAIGYNVLSEPVRRAALERARDTGRAAASGPVPLVQHPDDEGFLVFAPVYRHGIQPTTLDARRRHLEGFVVAAFRIHDLVETTLRRLQGFEGKVRLYDTTGSTPQLLYSNADTAPVGFKSELALDVAGRQWRADVQWPEQALLARRSWSAWLVLAGGLMLTALLGILLLTTIGRTGRVESLVTLRTRELAQANAKLGEHSAALANSNRELEQFAYVTSHDLKAPLRTISSFVQLLEQRFTGVLGTEGREFLSFIADGARHMQGLIDDLLKLSQVDRRQLALAPMRLQAAVDRACSNLAADLAANGAQVKADPLPEVRGDVGMLSQLFQNLIANSIKFMPAGRKPQLRIEAHPEGTHWDTQESALSRWQRIESRPEGTRWHVIVSDNGIGMDERHLEQIFSVFKRLHTADQYPGNGIGLAICKKVVAFHGGEIWARSELGHGTAIHFTLPGAATPAAVAV